MSTSGKTRPRDLDMTNGSIWDKLPMFALPVAATAILQQLFNSSDLIVVGNFTGAQSTTAVAAVGANAPVIGLIVNLFMGLGLGVNVVLATAIGRKDTAGIFRSVHTGVATALIGGVLIGALGELVSAPVLRLISVPDDVFPMALTYLRIYFLGMPVISLYNFEAAIYRSVGNTRLPLAALAIAGVLNIFLNLFFVIVFRMTVDGVAWATVASNLISSLILFHCLMTTKTEIHLDPRKLSIDKKILFRFMRIGFPAGIQGSVFSLSNIVIQSAINSLGTTVMAGSSAAANIESISYFMMNSFASACTTFTGQNYGAGKPLRCRKVLGLSILESAVSLSIGIVLTMVFGRVLLSFFDDDPAVIEAGYIRLYLVLSSYYFCMLYEIMTGYLRGFGISFVPALITTVVICGLRLFWIRAIFPQSMTLETIMWIYPISLGVNALFIFFALLKYRPSVKSVKPVI